MIHGAAGGVGHIAAQLAKLRGAKVLDLVGGDTQERSWGVLKPGGYLISTTLGVRAAQVVSNPPIKATLIEMAGLVDAGDLKARVSQVLSLDQIHSAHHIMEALHTRGKTVL